MSRNGEIGRRQANELVNQLEGAGVNSEHIQRMQENPKLREQVASLLMSEGPPSKGTLEEGYRELAYEELFDRQIATLENREMPEQIVKMLINMRDSVLSQISDMSFEGGNIPFLPVVPFSYCSVYSLMEMVRNGKTRGCVNNTNPVSITDITVRPNQPYYIFDVMQEDESSISMHGDYNISGNYAITVDYIRKLLGERSRSALTLAETIAFAIHASPHIWRDSLSADSQHISSPFIIVFAREDNELDTEPSAPMLSRTSLPVARGFKVLSSSLTE